MPNELIVYADDLATRIRAAGVKVATIRASAAVPPCVLVVPIPSRSYDIQHGYTATWSLIALAPPPGDAKAAEQLDDLVNAIATVVPLETAEPIAYQLPTGGDPVPAYLCKFTTEVEHHS